MRTWLAMAITVAGCGGDGGGEGEAESEAEAECETDVDLTGTFGVQAMLNVTIESPSLGVDIPPASSQILLRAEMAQAGAGVTVTALICDLEIPPVMLMGSPEPMTFEPHQDLIGSIAPVSSQGTLDTSGECAAFSGQPLTAVAGANLEPITTSLPEDCCAGATPPLCGETTCTNLACDQEGDGRCGATVYAMNTPVPIDEVYVVIRTSFALEGTAPSGDRIEGEVLTPPGENLLEQAIIGCSPDGMSDCDAPTVGAVRALNPIITQNPDMLSTFLAVRIDDALDCGGILAMQGQLFR